MGCGAIFGGSSGDRSAAREAAPTSTALPSIGGQVALAVFAVVKDDEKPKESIRVDSWEDDAPNVAWQSGNVSCEGWTDLSSVAMLAIEDKFNEAEAGFGEGKQHVLEVDDESILVDFDKMSMHKCGDEGFTNDLQRTDSLESVNPDTVFPLRRLVAQSWEVSHPDPGEIHPLRSEKIEKKDGDDWMNNDFFWRGFQQVMKQAGHTVEQSSAEQMFDFVHNQDFRSYKGKVENQKRGGYEYKIPVGYKRFALRVANKYDDGNNTWMCLDGRKGEWAVAYHGTKQHALVPIIMNGLQAGSRQLYASEVGDGIYCSPDLDGVALAYATMENLDSHAVRFILQCRVRPNAIKKCSRSGYWVINKGEDIRPYGILVKEC